MPFFITFIHGTRCDRHCIAPPSALVPRYIARSGGSTDRLLELASADEYLISPIECMQYGNRQCKYKCKKEFCKGKEVKSVPRPELDLPEAILLSLLIHRIFKAPWCSKTEMITDLLQNRFSCTEQHLASCSGESRTL